MASQHDILLNRIAQGSLPRSDGEEWFQGLPHDEQKLVLRDLYYYTIQAGVLETDVVAAIADSKLKPTYTPCVMASKGRLFIQLGKIVNLPTTEYHKAYRLLVSLFTIADERRRRERCRGECSHWWHLPGI